MELHAAFLAPEMRDNAEGAGQVHLPAFLAYIDIYIPRRGLQKLRMPRPSSVYKYYTRRRRRRRCGGVSRGDSIGRRDYTTALCVAASRRFGKKRERQKKKDD